MNSVLHLFFFFFQGYLLLMFSNVCFVHVGFAVKDPSFLYVFIYLFLIWFLIFLLQIGAVTWNSSIVLFFLVTCGSFRFFSLCWMHEKAKHWISVKPTNNTLGRKGMLAWITFLLTLFMVFILWSESILHNFCSMQFHTHEVENHFLGEVEDISLRKLFCSAMQ